jgi:hypothetical protein
MNKVTISILGALLVASVFMNVFEYRRLAWFENKFGTYEEFFAAQKKADEYAELRKHPVIVYMREEAPEDEILNWRQSIPSSADIETIEYVSKDRAIEISRSAHSYSETVSYNESNLGHFRASFIVLVKDLSKRESVATFIKSHDPRSIIDEVEIP